jgi:hypothetical protein
MRLIDADKLLEWLEDKSGKSYATTFINSTYNGVIQEVESGTFDPTPTPPVQPDIKPGDRIRHKDHKHFGIGIVDDIAKSGLRAFCYFPDYDRRRSHWEPRSYYRLDKLEVITDDQPTEKA